MLYGKKILVGITGSIAAYKAAIIVRALIKRGAEVRVIMTPTAKEFITPLTLATLSKNPILVDFFDPEDGRWNSHIALSEWADCYLIAPATANTLAKMATGIADNLLLTTYLSSRSAVVVAPAMDLDMYAHSATQQNLATLRSRGVAIVEPQEGELASGLSGKGRMADEQTIIALVEDVVDKGNDQSDTQREEPNILAGQRLIVTAGPTVEAIDPVRFITNHSTGKMGYAIAAEAARRGAEVTLVSGPTQLPTPAGCRRIDTISAEDMYRITEQLFDSADAAVMCAAVADYTPATPSNLKIKKSDDEWVLQLKRTTDIAARLGNRKEGRILIGFALETDHELENARSKMERKNLDLIVLNSMNDPQACFGVDTNKVTILHRNGTIAQSPLESKSQTAVRVVNELEILWKQQKQSATT